MGIFLYRSLIFDRNAIDHDLWRVFVGPNNPDQLAYDPEDSKLRIADGEDTTAAIAGLTDDDHKQIASDFARSRDHSEASTLLAVLGQNDYWPAWRRLLASDPKLFKDWMKFRAEAIRIELKQRLIKVGVADAEADVILATFRPTSQHKKAIQKQTTRIGGANASDMRAQIKLAIDRMSEAELLALCLPAHALLAVSKPG